MFWLCSFMAAYQGAETTGFQSPAQDYIEPVVDLAAMLSLRQPGKYPVRVLGQALRERGIHHGDILIANAAADPKPGRVCVAIIGNDVILATLILKEGNWLLKPSTREPVSEVWGIGKASMAKLEKSGVHTVAQFVAMPDKLVCQMLTVTGLRTLKELRGTSCMAFSEMPPTKKTLAVTRSFGRAITEWDEMREAVASYAARAAEKMRRHGLVASAMQVFMRTNEFNNDPKYANQITLQIEPTADSMAIIGTAVRSSRSLWREGFRYAKAGVIFVDLSRADDMPEQLFPSRDPARSKALMKALDLINLRYGRDTLRPGGIAQKASWSMRRANLSPRYTTCPNDVLRAHS